MGEAAERAKEGSTSAEATAERLTKELSELKAELGKRDDESKDAGKEGEGLKEKLGVLEEELKSSTARLADAEVALKAEKELTSTLKAVTSDAEDGEAELKKRIVNLEEEKKEELKKREEEKIGMEEEMKKKLEEMTEELKKKEEEMNEETKKSEDEVERLKERKRKEEEVEKMKE